MKKRLIVLIAAYLLLLMITVPTLASIGRPCGYCDGTFYWNVYGYSPEYTKTEPCVHHPNGNDIIYYRYEYCRWKCDGCGFTYGHKEVYDYLRMECQGY